MHPLMYSNNASINILRTNNASMNGLHIPGPISRDRVSIRRCRRQVLRLSSTSPNPLHASTTSKPLHTSTTSETLSYLYYLQALLILLLPPWESAQHLQNPYIPPPNPLHTSATSETLTYLFCLQDLSILLLLPKSCYTTYTYTYTYTYIYIYNTFTNCSH